MPGPDGTGGSFELACGGQSQKPHGRLDPDRLLRDKFKYTGREEGLVREETAFVKVHGTYHMMDMLPPNSDSRPGLHRPAVWLKWRLKCSVPYFCLQERVVLMPVPWGFRRGCVCGSKEPL